MNGGRGSGRGPAFNPLGQARSFAHRPPPALGFANVYTLTNEVANDAFVEHRVMRPAPAARPASTPSVPVPSAPPMRSAPATAIAPVAPVAPRAPIAQVAPLAQAVPTKRAVPLPFSAPPAPTPPSMPAAAVAPSMPVAAAAAPPASVRPAPLAPVTGETPVALDVAAEHADSLDVGPGDARSKRPRRLLAFGAAFVVALGLVFVATRGGGKDKTAAPAGVVVAATAKPAPASITATDDDASWPGVLLAPASVDIAPTIDGRLADVKVKIGDHVDKDAIVALLDDRLHKDALAVAQASKHAASAEAMHARIELSQAKDRESRRDAVVKLDDGQTLAIVSGEEAAQAKFASKAAASRAMSAGAGAAERTARVKQLRTALTETQLRAPFEGIVAARYMDPGAFIRPGQVVLRIIATSDLHVRFAVSEERARKVVAGATVKVLVDDKVLEASVDSVAPEVEASSRTVFVDASLKSVSGAAAAALAGRVVRVKTTR